MDDDDHALFGFDVDKKRRKRAVRNVGGKMQYQVPNIDKLQYQNLLSNCGNQGNPSISISANEMGARFGLKTDALMQMAQLDVDLVSMIILTRKHT